MDDKVNPSLAPDDISLVRGGPSYRIQKAVGLVRRDHWNLGRRLSLVIAVGWLPLLLTTAFSGRADLLFFLTDYRIHARMLIGIPALLLGETLMESRLRTVFAHIREAGLLEAGDLAYMDRVAATLMRIRDAVLPELVVVVLLIIHTTRAYMGLAGTTSWMGHGSGADFHIMPAGWYVMLVSAPLFQFLLGLSLWRWLLWSYFAFRLSTRNLKLVATHPDGHGGLGFLGNTLSAFAPIAFAATTVVGATWRHEILQKTADLMDFKLPAATLAVIIALFALGPLVVFVPGLAALRRRGIQEYGTLGQIHSTGFHEKWILHRAGHESEFLQAPEIGALNSFGNSYARIIRLRPFPADVGDLYLLAAAVAIPVLPVVLAEIPLAVVLKDLLKALR